jgi:hypothetical protein
MRNKEKVLLEIENEIRRSANGIENTQKGQGLQTEHPQDVVVRKIEIYSRIHLLTISELNRLINYAFREGAVFVKSGIARLIARKDPKNDEEKRIKYCILRLPCCSL